MKQGNDSSTNLIQQTIHGFFWNFSGIGVQSILRIIVLAILARLLTPEDFGLIGAALVVVGLSTVFSQLGVGSVIVQRSELELHHLRVGFTLSILFSLLLYAIVWILSPYIAGFFEMDQLVLILRVLSFVFVLKGLSIVAESLLQRELRFRVLAGLEVVSYLVGYGLIGITLAVVGMGVWALVGAYLGQAFIKTIGLLIVKRHPLWPSLEKAALREFMFFGSGFTLAKITNYIAGQGDNLMVGRLLGAQALGVYGRAYEFLVMPATLFGQVVSKVLFPVMAKVQSEPQRLALAYQRSIATIAIITLPTSIGLLILAPELVHILLGPQWEEVVLPFQILTIGMLFRTSYKLSDSLAKAKGAVYEYAWRQGMYAFLVLIGGWIGHAWGVPGIAAGVLMAITVNFLLMAQLSLQLTQLSWRIFFRVHLPGTTLAIAVGAMVFVTTFFFRIWELPYILTITVSSLLAALATLFLCYQWPQTYLGSDGRRMLDTLIENLPKRLRLFVSYKRRVI